MPRYAYARVIATASAWWAGEHARAAGHIEVLRGLAPTFTSGERRAGAAQIGARAPTYDERRTSG